jgi:hypothetical protein
MDKDRIRQKLKELDSLVRDMKGVNLAQEDKEFQGFLEGVARSIELLRDTVKEISGGGV